MGEIIKHRLHGEMKLGTCQDLYYITYDQLKKEVPNMMRVDGNLLPIEYLNPKYEFRYRFPFPDEMDWNQPHENYNRGVQIVIPRNLFKQGDIEVAHDKTFMRNEETKGWPFGVYLPCPADEIAEFKFNDWNGIHKNLIVEIVQQRIVNNQLVTIVRCPFCKQLSRMSEEEITLMHRIIHSEVNPYDDFTKQVIDVALAGYTKFTTKIEEK